MQNYRHMKKVLSIVFSLVIINSFSQNENRKWAVGVNFGTKEYYGDLGSEFWTFINNHGGFGVNVYRYLNPSFDIMGSYSHGLIDFEGGKGTFINSLFDYNVSAKYKFNNGYLLAEDNRFQPFVFLGIGATYSETGHYRNINESSIDLGVPGGLGLNIKLNDAWSIELRSLVKYTFSDSIDNNNDSPFETNFTDVFTYHSVGVVYSFGKTDSDKDGVVDKDDKCPNLAGSIEAGGCPDDDKDGFANSEDDCPTIAGTLKGCPDTDGDLIADKDDQCPNKPGTINGCPDSDKDNVADHQDECPTVYGTVKGCPDRDNDGVADKNDKCPDLIGNNEGCPDRDGDGFNDNVDACPDEKGTIKGCPDSDNDGLADAVDMCPKEAGPMDNKGCPIINKEEEEVMVQAMKGLQFKSGSAVILTSSYPILDNVVKVMKNNAKIQLSIEGHTDNVGNPTFNLNLSKQRAEAARNYLIKKGVEAARVFAIGFGDSRPITTNDTDEGRQENRRVEFVVR